MEDLESMSREELVAEVIHLRENVHSLEHQLQLRQEPSQQQQQAPVPYQMSFHVLLISGDENHRKTESVPLHKILARAQGREDQREPDTPAIGTGGVELSLRLSSEILGRASDFSVESFDSPERKPPTPDFSVQANRPKMQPLTLGKPVLDNDAIISHQTLHNFSLMYGGGALTPQSGTATALVSYLVSSFAKKNNFSHDPNPQQLEALARTIMSVCNEVEHMLKSEEPHPTIPSPCYVFGDIHGNFKDLFYFLSNIVNFSDLRFTPFHILFLGDYVDRGAFSVEVVAYLLALKLLSPSKVTLLRGNHEDTLVNGDISLYGPTSFRKQCQQLFGNLLGEQVWARCNRVFTWLPLTCNIDHAIFCTHGGLPRFSGGVDDRMEWLTRRDTPKLESFFLIPNTEPPQNARYRQIAADCCWSDPADDDEQTDTFGFGANPRGGGVMIFGSAAVDSFLERYGFQYIFRAHQEKSDGLKVSKNARVVTIFSTSGYVGHHNGAGVVFVADNKIRLVIKEADADPPPEGE